MINFLRFPIDEPSFILILHSRKSARIRVPRESFFLRAGDYLTVELVWPKVPRCFIVFFTHHSGSAKSLQSVRCPTHKNFLRGVRLSRKGVRRSNNQESKSE
jgi:hypothetical protein